MIVIYHEVYIKAGFSDYWRKMSAATQRLVTKRQTLDEAYAPPANFLEIEVVNPITHGVGKNRYTDYEVRLRVS